MLFCLGASVPKEDEYHFLSEEDDDVVDDLVVDLVNEDHHHHHHLNKILDLDQESHDNCINAGLLQAAVQAVVNNSNNNNNNQTNQTKSSASLLHRHNINHRNQSTPQQVKQTLKKKLSSCSLDHHNHHHHSSVVAKFVDTNSSSTTTTPSTASSLAHIGNNNITTGVSSSSSPTANINNNTGVISTTPTTTTPTTTGSTLLSKFGPAHLQKKFSQLRSSKGTEHLQREAIRKSNEQAQGKSVYNSNQRYIKLPPSPHSKKFSTTISSSINDGPLKNNNNPIVECNNNNNKDSCDSLSRTKLKQHKNKPIQSIVSSSQSKTVRSKSPSNTSSSSSSTSLTPPSGNKNTNTNNNPNNISSICGIQQQQTQPPTPPPPSLVPRSANNPPPRPKADKPNKSNMSSSSSSSTPRQHNVAAAAAVASSTMMILSSSSSSSSTNITNNTSTTSITNNNNNKTTIIDSLSHSQNGESLQQKLNTTTSSSSHPSSSTCSQPTSTTTLISSKQTPSSSSSASTSSTTAVVNNNNNIGAITQPASSSTSSQIDPIFCSLSTSTPSASTASTSGVNANNNNNSNNPILPHHSHHHHQHQQFINKPPRGWLHPDHELTDSGQGVTYTVRYIGCLGVNTSMKSLDFQTRSLIAKESINRVCEAAGLKTVDKKRRTDKRIAGMLADSPNMEHAGVDANLSITISYLTLTLADTGETLAKHEMPNISFASGGDTDTLDFAAYVAKDSRFERACFVLECEGGRAQEVITTIGQAFELRFNEFLKRNPLSSTTNSESNHLNGIHKTNLHPSSSSNQSSLPPRIEDREYYNDLPGKIPPDILNNNHSNTDNKDNNHQVNLIDLNDDTTTATTSKLLPITDRQYVNCLTADTTTDKDPFDMQPFNNALASHVSSSSQSQSLDYVLNSDLSKEEWFHGPISRKDSETLVLRDGDFLVRESQQSPGQYVLTGMQGGSRKHLLLVDPEGVVRTKDKTFDSVSHLINYHRNNGLPIISSESALVLKHPIIVMKKK